MELFLVRHGQSLGNTMSQDMPDSPLTDLGLTQAEQLAAYLQNQPVARIIASPLIRAMQTALPLSNALSLPIEVWKELYEYREGCSFGGPSREELRRLIPQAVFPEDMEEGGWIYPGGENPQHAMDRAKAVVSRIRQLEEEAVAVFAHGMFNAYLIREILEISGSTHMEFLQWNTGISHFSFGTGTTGVRELNNNGHLEPSLRT
ncbi:histidine phosphatase family protein [Gorillibacterium sp. sgz500922]|uniref:histidine phosphatase family protein n=1 Tax=Gorillibacterium sp. sgz500922 TaxID=3446694 RepID=UPI003F67E463